MDNRERALQIFSVASLLEARGANPYRVRAYRRAAVRLLTLREDASAYLDEQGELDLPGLGQRLRRKLGELTRTGQLSFHDELIAALPRPIRTLMSVPGIGPKTAERLVDEAHVRGLKSLARAAHSGRLQRLRGIGPTREQRWAEAADLLLAGRPAAEGLVPVAAVPEGAVPETAPLAAPSADAAQAALPGFDAVADAPAADAPASPGAPARPDAPSAAPTRAA